MALASPVWEKLLARPKLPIQGANNVESSSFCNHDSAAMIRNIQTLDFTGDRGVSLLILLLIAHLQFSHIPQYLHTFDIYDLAVLCEKYEYHDLVRLWLKQWLEFLIQMRPLEKADRWLYITWAFGRQSQFAETAMNVVKQATISAPCGKIIMANTEFNALPMPEMIIGSMIVTADSLLHIVNGSTASILQVRLETVQRVLDLPYTYVTLFDHGRSSVCKLKSTSCDEVRNILNTIPSPVLDCHREHMEKRSRPRVLKEHGPATEDAATQ